MNQDLIKEVLYYQEISPGVLILVLAIAFVLGAIHALGPGHGKSLMASYLVGSRGRIRDVFTLGITITISHIFSVVIIGFLDRECYYLVKSSLRNYYRSNRPVVIYQAIQVMERYI
jgi:ABC-type nickel/cobalt efflux system permease component RcnA